MAPPGPRLFEKVRNEIRTRHYSRRTEASYIRWIRRFVAFHGRRHPAEMGEGEVTSFLSHLATDLEVGASTQNQALSALLFLYRRVLGRDLDWLRDVVRAKTPRRLPVVLTRTEAFSVLRQLHTTKWLMAVMLYGAGLRVLECVRLRIKDLDLETAEIAVRGGKGDKDRRTMLPTRLIEPLGRHLHKVRRQYEKDLSRGAGWVELPRALGRKYPNAGREWPDPPPPLPRDRPAAGRPRGRAEERHRQARKLPHLPPLVRDPPPRGRLRHPDRPAASGPSGRQHHDDLHPRPQPRPPGRAQPRGPAARDGRGSCTAQNPKGPLTPLYQELDIAYIPARRSGDPTEVHDKGELARPPG